jgi:hypothetical protein
MIHHRCQLPAPDGKTTWWVCDDCQWAWRLNTTVLHWFREIPEHPSGYP